MSSYRLQERVGKLDTDFLSLSPSDPAGDGRKCRNVEVEERADEYGDLQPRTAAERRKIDQFASKLRTRVAAYFNGQQNWPAHSGQFGTPHSTWQAVHRWIVTSRG